MIYRFRDGYTPLEVSNNEVLEIFEQQSGDMCSVAVYPHTCDSHDRYRSADGSCNNLDHSGWGMAFTSQERLIANAYGKFFTIIVSMNKVNHNIFK